MAISFNQIASDNRVPFVFVEFDTSRAIDGNTAQPYNALIIGQKLSGGSKPNNQIDRVTSAEQAKEYYGAGSMLFHMAKAYFAQQKSVSLSMISLADDVGGVKAAGSIQFTGPATENGTAFVYVAGRRYTVGITDTDTATAIVAALVAKIQADDDRQVDAAVNGGDPTICDLTARNAGEFGNSIDIRTNYFDGEELPAGVGTVIVPMASGTANPSVAPVITAMADTHYNTIAMPYSDAANLLLMETEMDSRNTPQRQIDGVVFIAKKDTFGNLITFGDGRNSRFVSAMGMSGPTPEWEWASASMAQVALSASIDPALQFNTLALAGVLPGTDSENFIFSERDQLLKDGISTFKVIGNVVQLERMITMFQVNAAGGDSVAYLDVFTMTTLSKLRYDFRQLFLSKYGRHKLANDGTRFGPGQKVITPKIAKGETLALFEIWERAGLVEDADQFAEDLIVERNEQDKNRLDFLLSPNLINNFITGASQIQFIL